MIRNWVSVHADHKWMMAQTETRQDKGKRVQEDRKKFAELLGTLKGKHGR